LEPISCIFYTYERPSGDYPGSQGCTLDHCTDNRGVFRPEHCPDCDEDHGCGRDCPGWEAA
jgi:hypothetical protein